MLVLPCFPPRRVLQLKTMERIKASITTDLAECAAMREKMAELNEKESKIRDYLDKEGKAQDVRIGAAQAKVRVVRASPLCAPSVWYCPHVLAPCVCS